MSDYQKKLIEMGRVATSMCQLHLEVPNEFGPRVILENLFNKFEELDLEEDIDQDEKSAKK